jgi:hypothetical protein
MERIGKLSTFHLEESSEPDLWDVFQARYLARFEMILIPEAHFLRYMIYDKFLNQLPSSAYSGFSPITTTF